MITLLADRPADQDSSELAAFGQLAGLWTTEIVVPGTDGTPARHGRGEWEFSYALDGRAVIDVWQVPGRDGLEGGVRRADQEIGLCVRIWDRGLELWRFTYHGTASGGEVQMFARRIGEEIVMERAIPGEMERWTFFDIRRRTFSWRSERSRDGGATWVVEQRVSATRVDR